MGKAKPESILQKDFSALTEKNKKSVIDMTRFLVLTQNNIVPSMLADTSVPSNEPEKQSLE